MKFMAKDSVLRKIISGQDGTRMVFTQSGPGPELLRTVLARTVPAQSGPGRIWDVTHLTSKFYGDIRLDK